MNHSWALWAPDAQLNSGGHISDSRLFVDQSGCPRDQLTVDAGRGRGAWPKERWAGATEWAGDTCCCNDVGFVREHEPCKFMRRRYDVFWCDFLIGVEAASSCWPVVLTSPFQVPPEPGPGSRVLGSV